MLRKLGLLVLHTLAALLGAAIFETIFSEAVHPHTVSGIIWRECLLSIAIAAVLGFTASRLEKSGVARWVWITPSLVFAVRIFSLLGTPHGSVLSSSGPAATLWGQLFGSGCSVDTHSLAYRDFFILTVPFLRSIGYSASAQAGLLAIHAVASDSNIPS